MGALLGGATPKAPSGPSQAELEAQRKEAERQRLAEERALEQRKSKEKRAAAAAAEETAQTKKRGYASTIATDGEGLLEEADVLRRGEQTKFGG